MADAIILRSGGAAALDDITANASDILAPKVGLNKDGDPITGTIPSMAAQTVTPSNKSQTVSTSGKYMTGNVTVNAVSNLTAANIKQGVTVGGVAGNFTSDANATAGQILAGRTAYVNGQKITGTIASKGAQTVTPTKSTQRVSVNGNYMTGDITVNPIPSNYITTSDANAVASDIRQGITAYVRGVKVIGNVSDYDGTLTSLSSSNVLWEPTSKWLLVRVPNGIYRDASNYISQSVLASKIGLTASKILAQQEVANIAGTATSDANAIASQILQDKTAYVNGKKITGSMRNQNINSADGYAGILSSGMTGSPAIKTGHNRGYLNNDTSQQYWIFGVPSGYYDGKTAIITKRRPTITVTPNNRKGYAYGDTYTDGIIGEVIVNGVPDHYWMNGHSTFDWIARNPEFSTDLDPSTYYKLSLKGHYDTTDWYTLIEFPESFRYYSFFKRDDNKNLILGKGRGLAFRVTNWTSQLIGGEVYSSAISGTTCIYSYPHQNGDPRMNIEPARFLQIGSIKRPATNNSFGYDLRCGLWAIVITPSYNKKFVINSKCLIPPTISEELIYEPSLILDIAVTNQWVTNLSDFVTLTEVTPF